MSIIPFEKSENVSRCYMKCPECGNKMVESNLEIEFDEESKIFYEEYFCFHCYCLYVCNSQSGDMIPENLDSYGIIEIVY